MKKTTILTIFVEKNVINIYNKLNITLEGKK